jgi:hypothetical protein
MSNMERQNRGEACVRHWKWCAGEVPTGTLGEEDCIDIVTDVLHYAKIRGIDLDAVIRCAIMNQEAEEQEDG